MRIAFLSSPLSIHTARWVNEMAKRGHDVHLISVHRPGHPVREGVEYHRIPIPAPFGYYLAAPLASYLIGRINPDIVHAHYASGYGTLARVAGRHPLVLSVWGSDVFVFPDEAPWKRRVLVKNLGAADTITSTSYVMKKRTEEFVGPGREIEVVPFGIESDVFRPGVPAPPGAEKNPGLLRIGTVKTLYPNYGIGCLIEAFARAKGRGLPPAELVIVGGGPQEAELKILVRKLNISESVRFVGEVPHAEVPNWLNTFDVYAALTVGTESFGVAVIEASACGVPVVVSDVGGFREVVVDGETGFIVPRNDPDAAAEKLLLLSKDSALRGSMGARGRDFVVVRYVWSDNADSMEQVYEKTIRKYKKG